MALKEDGLSGKRILITRAPEQAKPFSEKLKQLGGIPIEIPLISIEPASITDSCKDSLLHMSEFEWLIFTSVNGVKCFFHILKELHIDISTIAQQPKIAVVGKKTLHELTKRGLRAEIVPENFVAEDLIDIFKRINIAGKRVLIAKGNLARTILPNELRRLGAVVEDYVVYNTIQTDKHREKLLEVLHTKEIDVITFTSSSTVKNFVSLLSGHNMDIMLRGIIVACIGPITEKTAKDYGIYPTIVANTYTTDGLIDSIAHYFNAIV